MVPLFFQISLPSHRMPTGSICLRHLTHVIRLRLPTSAASFCCFRCFPGAAPGCTSKIYRSGRFHPMTPILCKPELILYSLRSLPFPVFYSLCKIMTFVKTFSIRCSENSFRTFLCARQPSHPSVNGSSAGYPPASFCIQR